MERKVELNFKIGTYQGWKATVDTINRIKAEYGDGNHILRIEIENFKCLTDEEYLENYSTSSSETH